MSDAMVNSIVASIAFDPSDYRVPDEVELTVYSPDIFRVVVPSVILSSDSRPRVSLNVIRIEPNEMDLPPLFRSVRESPFQGLAKICKSLNVRDIAFFGLLENEFVDPMRSCSEVNGLEKVKFVNSSVDVRTPGFVVDITGLLEFVWCDFVGSSTEVARALLKNQQHFRVGDLKVANCKGKLSGF